MPYCSGCQTITAQDEPEIDSQDCELNDTSLTAQVRLVINCAEGGEELKSTDFELEADLDAEHQCDAELAEDDCGTCDGTGGLKRDEESGESVPSYDDDAAECGDCGGTGRVEVNRRDKLVEEGEEVYALENEPDFEPDSRSVSSGPAWRYEPIPGTETETLVLLKRNMKPREGEEVEIHNGKRYVRRMQPRFRRLPDIDPKTGRQRIKQWGYRFTKTFYGVTGTATIRCNVCESTFDVELSDEIAASGMDEAY